MIRISQTALASLQFIHRISLIYSIIELAFIYYSFGLKAVTHIGYALDMTVVLTQTICDVFTSFGIIVRVLNMIRLWRVVRVCNTLIAVEHDQTVQAIDLCDNITRVKVKLDMQVQEMASQIEHHNILTREMQEMVQAYKVTNLSQIC